MLHGIKRVVCGISGGVDSAVAAALIQKKGFEVVGAFMENWDEQDEDRSCQLKRENDLEDAKSICQHLKIPFVQVSFVKDYWNDVFSTLIKDYEDGLTPNPDVLCNRYLKFGSFYKYAKEHLKADAIATGHYAQTSFGSFLEEFSPNRHVHLIKGIDPYKDQTLFLSSVPQEPLRRTMFPLGKLYKTQVRRLAREFGMESISKKRDSVGICFIGNRTFPNFISEYVKNTPGPFVDLDTGQVIGEHNGVHQWTVGQRCRIPGSVQAFYVAGRDPKSQTIFAVFGHDHPALYSSVLFTAKPHWISDIPSYSTTSPFTCMFKFQHTKWTIPAQLSKVNDENAKIWLATPTRAITPGQQAVLYHNNICLGGAKILWTDVMDKIGLSKSFSPDGLILDENQCNLNATLNR